MVVDLLGILKAGGAYVLLAPLYPLERPAFMLAGTQASVLLTRRHRLGGLPRTTAQVVCVDADRQVIA
jgi:non-ribosomal peptide synthetase component F